MAQATLRKMATPRVSVLMPVYNRSLYLSQSIESIKNQTLSDWELILVDDGSTDNSFEIAQKYAQSDTRIRAIRQQNAGVSAALNAGLALAKGLYVARNDDDDLSLPKRFERQAHCLEQKPELAAVVSPCELIDEKGQHLNYDFWVSRSNQFRFLRPAGSHPARTVLNNPSAMFRRDALLQAKGWRLFFKRMGDYDLALRLESQYAVGVTPYPFYRYRMHSSGEQLTGDPSLLLYEFAALISLHCRLNGMDDPIDRGDDLEQVLTMSASVPDELLADARDRVRIAVAERYRRGVEGLLRRGQYSAASRAVRRMRTAVKLSYGRQGRRWKLSKTFALACSLLGLHLLQFRAAVLRMLSAKDSDRSI